jgi:hypothetical protein
MTKSGRPKTETKEMCILSNCSCFSRSHCRTGWDPSYSRQSPQLVNWPTPQNQTDVRGILGLANYYRRFVHKFSHIVKPLTELTAKDKPFLWSDECQKAFDIIKTILTSSPVMAYPMSDCPYILDTDASNLAIVSVPSQVQYGVERVIAYGSKTLNKCERRYCVADRELLAVKYYRIFRHMTRSFFPQKGQKSRVRCGSYSYIASQTHS